MYLSYSLSFLFIYDTDYEGVAKIKNLLSGV